MPSYPDIVTALGGTIPTPGKDRFNPKRYPYTYCADFLRACGVAESRGEANGRLRDLVGDDGYEAAARECAEGYFALYGTAGVPRRDWCPKCSDSPAGQRWLCPDAKRHPVRA